jgi:hypothetical protein
MKFTSRILEGLTARRGLVEPREGIGCWVLGLTPLGRTGRGVGLPFLYWVVVGAVEVAAVDPSAALVIGPK